MSGRRTRRAVAAFALGPLMLAGCSTVVPEVDPDPVPPTPLPVLSVEQTEDVLAAVGEVLAEADEAEDADALKPRVGQPARDMRSAQYTLADRSDGEREPTPITTDHEVLVVAATDEWPRTVMVVTKPPEESTVQLLLALEQEEPRSRYTLRSWVRLFPGTETPGLASPEVGSPVAAADAEGLVATPADTIAWYADVLAKGEDSEHAADFESDPYSEQLAEGLASSRSTLDGIADVTFSASAVDDQLAALGTADGGAVVVGTITSTTTYKKTLEGSTVTLGGDVGDWLGDGDVPETATLEHTSTVAFYVPVAGDDATITVLGAERALVDASAD